MKYRVFLFFAIMFLAISAFSFTRSNFCMRCYHEKLILMGQCYVHPELNALYPKWCLKEIQSAKALHFLAPVADKLMGSPLLKNNKGKYFLARVPKGKTAHIPFNYCDACINNMVSMRSQCTSKHPEPIPKAICSNQYVKFFAEVTHGTLYGGNPTFVVQRIP